MSDPDVTASHSRFHYTVDQEDRIVAVSAMWLAFARQNDADELDRDNVVGRLIWEFMSGEETQHLYRLIFSAVRANQRPAVLPFRCDSPTARRYMQLTIAPLSDSALELRSVLLREEPRDHMPLLDPGSPRGDEVLAICSWCKRVRLPEQAWVEAEDAVRKLELFDVSVLPNITHGLCGACESSLLEELDGPGRQNPE